MELKICDKNQCTAKFGNIIGFHVISISLMLVGNVFSFNFWSLTLLIKKQVSLFFVYFFCTKNKQSEMTQASNKDFSFFSLLLCYKRCSYSFEFKKFHDFSQGFFYVYHDLAVLLPQNSHLVSHNLLRLSMTHTQIS